ncbi:MAG: hypothetical protein AVDCRST_MAG79-1415, partial [uncultured Thermoleophilia bacterium]
WPVSVASCASMTCRPDADAPAGSGSSARARRRAPPGRGRAVWAGVRLGARRLRRTRPPS